MSEFEDAVAAGFASAATVAAQIVQRAREAASVWDMPDSGVIFLRGDTVNITREDGSTQCYEVTKGDSPDTVWVDPYGPRQFEMRRIEDDNA